MMDKGQQFDTLADKVMGQLHEFFDGKEKTSQEVVVARVAASVLSAWTRHKQTEGARDATMFMMARELASDKDQLERYIRIAMPASSIVKALPVPAQIGGR